MPLKVIIFSPSLKESTLSFFKWLTQYFIAFQYSSKLLFLFSCSLWNLFRLSHTCLFICLLMPFVTSVWPLWFVCKALLIVSSCSCPCLNLTFLFWGYEVVLQPVKAACFTAYPCTIGSTSHKAKQKLKQILMAFTWWLDNCHKWKKLKSAQAKPNPDKPCNLGFLSFYFLPCKTKITLFGSIQISCLCSWTAYPVQQCMPLELFSLFSNEVHLNGSTDSLIIHMT